MEAVFFLLVQVLGFWPFLGQKDSMSLVLGCRYIGVELLPIMDLASSVLSYGAQGSIASFAQ